MESELFAFIQGIGGGDKENVIRGESMEQKEKEITIIKEKGSKLTNILLVIVIMILILPKLIMAFLFGFIIVLGAVGANSEFPQDTTYPIEEMYVEYSKNEETTDKVAQIFIDGVIQSSSGGGGFFSEAETMDDWMAQLDYANADNDVKAVVIHVNSPGGSVIASYEIYNKIKELKENGKKVIVSMGDVAASGGYYISAPADKIYANPHTMTGSLGVIISLPNYSEAASKIGYKETVIKSGDLKDIGNPLREMTMEEKEVFNEMITDSYEEFVQVISEGRKMTVEEVKKIADGRIYSGKKAKEIGLIDEFGNLEEATEGAKKVAKLKDANVVQYSSGVSGFDSFFMSVKTLVEDPLGTKGILKEKTGSPQVEYRLN